MALKDILTSAKYGDDIVLSLPDGTTATVGEMRSMGAHERQALISRQSALEAAEQGVMTRVNALKQAGLLDDQLNPVTTRQATAAIRSEVSAATGLNENDPLFGDLVKEFRSELAKVKTEAAQEITTLKSQYGQLAGATTQAVKGYLDDFYRATFATELGKLPESIRADVKLDAAIDYASKRKLTDEVGRLDIAGAIDRMTWEARKTHELTAVSKSAEQVKKDREALAAMQRPGVRTTAHTKAATEGFSPVDDKGRTKSLDEVIAAAGMDDDLWNSIGRSASGVVQ